MADTATPSRLAERISADYLRLNEELHAAGEYGKSGDRHAAKVQELAKMLNPASILDYGCGQGTLAAAMPYPIREYDPAIAGKNEEPNPADLVVCTDVLEHIEPDRLQAVLLHIRSLARLGVYFNIATRPAQKHLADGRNTHLIQKGWAWWLARLCIDADGPRFTPKMFSRSDAELNLVVE